MHGRCRALLIPPDYAFRGLYAYPVHHPYDSYAMPDLEHPNCESWAGLASVRGSVAHLGPGSVLFVPAFWCVPPAIALQQYLPSSHTSASSSNTLLWTEALLLLQHARAPADAVRAAVPQSMSCVLLCVVLSPLVTQSAHCLVLPCSLALAAAGMSTWRCCRGSPACSCACALHLDGG